MQNTPRLTSRNLFDDVFATIPANVVLHTGPVSLREKFALMEDGHPQEEDEDEDEERKKKYDAKDDDDDDGGRLAKSGDDSVVAGVSSSVDPVVVDLSAMMRRVAEARVARPEVEASACHVLHVELDADDEVVQEATKYAALFPALDDNDDGGHHHHDDDDDDNKNNNDHDQQGGRSKPDGAKRAAPQAEKTYSGATYMRSTQLPLSAEEQIALLRPEDGRRHKGRVVLFRHTKGFGFVAPEVGGPDVYLTRESVEFVFTRAVLEVFYGGKFPEGIKPRVLSRRSGRGDNDGVGKNNASVFAPASPVGCINRDGDSSLRAGGQDQDQGAGGTLQAAKESDMGGLEPKAENEAETTATADNNLVKRAAAVLTPEAAQLLCFFLQVGQPVVSVSEMVTFTVRWNHAGSRSSRRLRADNIFGIPANAYALELEQAWFGCLFSRSVGRRTEKKNSSGVSNDPEKREGQEQQAVGEDAAAAARFTSCLLRYRGTVRMYDADELRGNIRPDEGGSQDVFFYGDSVLWAPWMEPARCRLVEGLVVRYCIAGSDRQGRHIATLITAADDTPLNDANAVWASCSGNERGSRDGDGGGGGGGGSSSSNVEKREGGGRQDGANNRAGGGKGREEEAMARKRAREDELLLLEEDDYGIM